MSVKNRADDLKCRWKYKKIAVGRWIKKRRPEREKAIRPDLLDPLGLRKIYIFKSVTFGQLFHNEILDAAIAGKEDAGLSGRSEKGQIYSRKESNKVNIPIAVRCAPRHGTKLCGFAESFAPFTVFFGPFAAFIWTDKVDTGSFVYLNLTL